MRMVATRQKLNLCARILTAKLTQDTKHYFHFFGDDALVFLYLETKELD